MAEVLEYLAENAPVGYKSDQDRCLAFYDEAVSELSALPLFGGGSGAEACLQHHLRWLPDVAPTHVRDATLYDLTRSTLATLGFVRDFAQNDSKTYIVDWSEFAAAAISAYRQRPQQHA